MIRDITLGQYFPGTSLLHKTDARIKIIILIAFFVMLFAASGFLSLFVAAVTTLALCVISRIKASILLKAMKPLVFILIFTTVINIFFTDSGNLLLSLGFIKIYDAGLVNAAFVFIRLLALVAGTSVILSYTTSPLDLSDALERLLSPLKKIKVPVHEFAMMMTIALRFIPTLIEETDKIISAQKARGADFESGGVIKRAKALVPIIVPLFVSAFRRADELAEAMECRCYHGGEGRTKLKQPKLRPADFVFLACILALCVGIFFINKVELPWPITQ